jgi:site-specific DNA-methyltransferase (adenine-specific)
MGIHLYNKDSAELLASLEENSVDAIIVDPPFGVLKHSMEKGFDPEIVFSEYRRVLKPNGFLCYFGRQPTLSEWNCVANKLFEYKHELIWYKRNGTSFLNDVVRHHENIMIYCNRYKEKGLPSRRLNEVRRRCSDVIMSMADLTDASGVIRNLQIYEAALRSNEKLEKVLQALRKDKEAFLPKGRVNDVEGAVVDKKLKVLPRGVNTVTTLAQGYKPRSVLSFTPHNLCSFDVSGEGKGKYNVAHPSVKPSELMEYLVILLSNIGDIVLDSYMGSGSTGVACRNVGRSFIGCEISPVFFEICKERIYGEVEPSLFSE